jgi:hypothetical protein
LPADGGEEAGDMAYLKRGVAAPALLGGALLAGALLSVLAFAKDAAEDGGLGVLSPMVPGASAAPVEVAADAAGLYELDSAVAAAEPGASVPLDLAVGTSDGMPEMAVAVAAADYDGIDPLGAPIAPGAPTPIGLPVEAHGDAGAAIRADAGADSF